MKTQPDKTPILDLAKLPKPLRRPKATEAEAKAMDREAVRIVAEMKSSWFRLGSLIRKMIDTQPYEALGFRTMHLWMTARLGESMSSAFSAVRSVRALEGVPEKQLKRIGERNAHALPICRRRSAGARSGSKKQPRFQPKTSDRRSK